MYWKEGGREGIMDNTTVAFFVLLLHGPTHTQLKLMEKGWELKTGSKIFQASDFPCEPSEVPI